VLVAGVDRTHFAAWGSGCPEAQHIGCTFDIYVLWQTGTGSASQLIYRTRNVSIALLSKDF